MDKLFTGDNPLQAFHYLKESGLGDYLPLFPKETAGLNQSLPFATSLEGWAFLMIAGEFSAGTLSRSFKLSNDEHRFISAVYNAYHKRLEQPLTVDDIYRFDVSVLKASEKFYRAIFPQSSTYTDEELLLRKKDITDSINSRLSC